MTWEEAELCKLYHNGFNAAKISFFNQAARISSAVASATAQPVSMARIEHALPASCEGLWNPRYGTRSGFPFGGHCLPKDSQALACLELALLDDVSRDPALLEGQPAPPLFFTDVLEVNKLIAASTGAFGKMSLQPNLSADAYTAPADGAIHGPFPAHSPAQKGRLAAADAVSNCAGLHLLQVRRD